MSTTTLLRTVTASAVLAVALSATPLVGTVAAKNHKVPGNNGTLKVHEQGTPERTESNDPKVCIFNFEGYGFDKGQSGVIAISLQGGGKDRSIVKTIDMPAADADGYTETEYITVDNGHYKTTLYGKDVHGNVDYNQELKAKSKVIKVVCEDQGVVTPEAPTDTVEPEDTTPTTPEQPTAPEVESDDNTPNPGGLGGDRDDNQPGEVLAEAKGKGAGANLPEVLAATGNNDSYLGAVLTALAGAATYTATALLRRR